MTDLRLPIDEPVYARESSITVFNQLAVKIEMDAVTNDDYYAWLDHMILEIGELVEGARIAEKPTARTAPPLNTAIYYDTEDLRILPTGALLRTSCNTITHAFCAFKAPQDEHSVRRDHRYVFEGNEKRTIQQGPDSPEAVQIVRRLLSRLDIEHPATFLERRYGISGTDLWPSIRLDDHRYTFFAWLDGRDALRCSIDRAAVQNLRLRESARETRSFSEVEIAIYPQIGADVAADPRVVELIRTLSGSLCETFHTSITREIKYQRAAKVLASREAARVPLS